MSTNFGAFFNHTDSDVCIDLFKTTCRGEASWACTYNNHIVIHKFAFQNRSPPVNLNFEYVVYAHHISLAILNINSGNLYILQGLQADSGVVFVYARCLIYACDLGTMTAFKKGVRR